MVVGGGLRVIFAGAGIFRRPQGGGREAAKISVARIKSHLLGGSSTAGGTLARARITFAATRTRQATAAAARPHHARAGHVH